MGEKFANDMTHEGLTSKTHKQLIQFNRYGSNLGVHQQMNGLDKEDAVCVE